MAQRVGRGIALLLHDGGTRRGFVVSSTPRPHFTPGRDPVLILQEAEWAPGPVWKGGKSRPHWDSIPDRPAPSQSLYQLSYPAHSRKVYSKLEYKARLPSFVTYVLSRFSTLESPPKLAMFSTYTFIVLYRPFTLGSYSRYEFDINFRSSV